MYGLTPEDLRVILAKLQAHPQIDEAVLFGSRASGTFKKGSDVDIALKGKNIEQIVATVSGLLNEESPLPYFFDIIDYYQIDNDDLKNHIDRVGKIIYKNH